MKKKKDLKKWINIGFFIFKKNFFKYLDNKTMLEDTPLKKISKKKINCLQTFWLL